MINRILISSDLLRPRIINEKIEYFHKTRLDKYYYFLCYQIEKAVNVPVEKFSFSNTDFDFFKFYSLCNIDLKDIYSWLRIYDLDDIPSESIEYYKKYISNSLVIYHEAPNIIKKIHNILNIPYIDLNVHPIRFLDDNFLGFLTNKKEIFDRVKKYQIDENCFYMYANFMKAQTRSLPKSNLMPNSLLLAGQTNVDKSLCYNNGIMSILDFENQIKEFGSKYSKIYYKPHPYNDEINKVYEFLKQFEFVEIVNDNFYKLVSDDNISAVAAITSGTLYEAKYFGKEAIFLGEPYLHFDYEKNCEFSENTTLSIYNEFLNPAFWADILQDYVDVNLNTSPIILPHRSNELRTIFGDYWAQTELDPTVCINKKYSESRLNNKLSNLKKEIYSRIDKNVRSLQKEISQKADKFIYKEKIGQKRIVHIGKIKFSYHKVSKNELFNRPHSLIVDTTILCNNSCSFCWRSNKKDYLKNIQDKYSKNNTMDFNIYKKIIDDVVQYDSVRWFSLCGPMGDPMLNPMIADFYEYANNKNHFKTIAVNTNGLAINKHDIAKLLNNITEFSISVDSINPETYGKIHGSSSFLPQVIENIKSLVEYKKYNKCLATIVVRFTENDINIGEFPEFEKFFFDLGVDEINYTKIHGFAGLHKKLANKSTAKNCQQILGAINFNFKGDMTTCCVNWQLEPTFGNIQNNSIKEMWNNSKMKKWIKNTLNEEPCKDCSGIGHAVQHSLRIKREEYEQSNV